VGDRIAWSFCYYFRAPCTVDDRVALLAFVLLFAAYMLVDGILAIIAGVRAAQRHERWGWLIFEGILDLIAGGVAVIWPLIGAVVLTWWIAAYALIFGVGMLVIAFRLRGRRHESVAPSGAMPLGV
jgi:uncharacterized membrane protein HdeD (DUF308 family)